MAPHAAERLGRICFFSVIPGFGMLLSWVQSQVTLWQDGAEAVSEELLF